MQTLIKSERIIIMSKGKTGFVVAAALAMTLVFAEASVVLADEVIATEGVESIVIADEISADSLVDDNLALPDDYIGDGVDGSEDYYSEDTASEYDVTPSEYDGEDYAASPVTVTVDGVEYTCTGDTAVVAGYKGTGGDVVIHATVTDAAADSPKTYTVTEVKGSAFDGIKTITSVKFEGNIVSIGNYSFRRTSALKKVEFTTGTNLTIGNYAFEYSALEEIIFPSSMTSITVGDSVFEGSQIKEFIVPSALKNISYRMFFGCDKLKKVVFSEDVETIGESSFQGCDQLKTVEFEGNKIKDIAKEAFLGCKALESITIPEGVTRIGQNAFNKCYALSQVNFPSTLKTIDAGAFWYDILTEEVTIPYGVTTIGDSAFYGAKVVEMEIPETVVSFGTHPFYASKLKLIYGKTGSKAEEYANTNNFAFYDKSNPKVFTITYQDVAGATNPNPVTYKAITDKIVLNEPARNGYNFVRWVDSENHTVKDIPKYSMGDKTLKAIWNLVEYRINYRYNGGSTVSGAPNKYTIETDTITLVTPEKEGYKFCGWYTDENLTNQITTIPTGSTGDITIFAKWEAVKYNVVYHLKGGINSSENPEFVTYETGSKNLLDPKKKGYKFEGWFSEAGYVTQLYAANPYDRRDINVYAKWTPIKYTVKFNAHGGYGDMRKVFQTKYDKTITLPKNIYTREGYDFNGWNTNKNGNGTKIKDKAKVKNLTTVDNKNITLYAMWKAHTYTVKFNANGGTGKMKSISADYGKRYKLESNKFRRPGYKFAGWNTKPDGSGKAIKNKAQIKNLTSKKNGKITLYAQWR